VVKLQYILKYIYKGEKQVKKTLVTVAATAVLSSSFAAEAAANTYKVESGDSLWSIAREYNATISDLKAWNQLNSDIIFPNQVLKVANNQQNNTTSTTQTQTHVVKDQTETYTVKSGDTLIRIANNHSISLSDLKTINNISGHLIFPGQKLILKTVPTFSDNTAKPSPASQVVEPKGENTTTYTVQRGDTLSHISYKFGLSVNELKRGNGLSNDLIYIGQVLKLKIGKETNPTPVVEGAPAADKSSNNIIQEATSHLGKPYIWGGATPKGFDCSGFIHYVFNKSGFDITRKSSEGYYNRSYYVHTPSVGDLVFFENTYKKGISHLGIYVGNNKFIHAGDNGVEITSLDNSYWKSKFDGFKRFYDL
jgi:peptidoglycan DL-endopeptidase LytE